MDMKLFVYNMRSKFTNSTVQYIVKILSKDSINNICMMGYEKLLLVNGQKTWFKFVLVFQTLVK